MSDIGLAGGVTSTSPGFSDLSSAQSDVGFTGSDQPIYYTGTNIRRTPVRSIPTAQLNLFDLLKGVTSKSNKFGKVAKTVGDMIVPGRNTPLGVFSVLARNPTVSVMNAIAGAMMNMNRKEEPTSGLLGGLKDASKSKIGPSVDTVYDAFGDPVTVSIPDVKREELAEFGDGDFPTVKGAYSQPQFTFNPNEKVQPLNEMMFDAMGMKNQKFAFDITDPAFEAKDFAPGGIFSVLGGDRTGNIRREVSPDGRVSLIDVGI